jgi:hypothetical protein
VPFYEEEARERQRLGRGGKLSANLHQGKAAAQAAADLGVSTRSVYRAAKVLKRGTPELAAWRWR